MPYLMRIEMERTRRRIRDYLCNVFTGYAFEPKKLDRATGALALDVLAQRYAESSHFKGDLSKYTISDYNRESADNRILEHGARVWFTDPKGRVLSGIAYYNINNMWWVVSGRFGLTNVASFNLFAVKPDNLRLKRNGKLRRQRLEKEISRAVDAMKFERAAVLRDILFPGDVEVFNVWSNRHQLYHRANFCGYTADQSKAGKFTAAEVRGWDDEDNRVVPISSDSRVAA